MAALICESFGKLCGNCCSALTYPCQKCGECFSKVVCSPFFPYLAVTAVLNVPPAIWGLQALGLQCDDSSWLLVNGGLCIVHLVAAFYIVNRIQQHQEQEEHFAEAEVVDVEGSPEAKNPTTTSKQTSSDSNYHQMGSTVQASIFNMVTTAVNNKNPTSATRAAPATGDGGHEGRAGSVQRMSHVLCYDPGVAIYILIALGWLLWQTIGMSHVFANMDNDEAEADQCNTQMWTMVSITMGVLYAMLVCCTFACSLLCLG